MSSKPVKALVADNDPEMRRAGADGYFSKPFSLRDLVARLRAVGRRLATLGAKGTDLRIGDLQLNLERCGLRRAGVPVPLTPIEFSLLAYLMQHAGIPIEQGKLVRTIWGSEYSREPDYLRTYIQRLRKKIENDAMHPEYLLTVPWIGYRLCNPAKPAASLRGDHRPSLPSNEVLESDGVRGN